jgi:hypothetical protein
MESVQLYVSNKEQVDLLYKLLSHLDFVKFSSNKKKSKIKSSNHTIFDSVGLWENREITQETLRAKAWKRD